MFLITSLSIYYLILFRKGLGGGKDCFRKHAVAQWVEALRYKPEGRGFDSRCHLNFSLTLSFRLHYGPRVDSACNRNEYQEYFLGIKDGRCVGLTLPPSCPDCLEIWKHQPPGTPKAFPCLQWNCSTFRQGIKLTLLGYKDTVFTVVWEMVF